MSLSRRPPSDKRSRMRLRQRIAALRHVLFCWAVPGSAAAVLAILLAGSVPGAAQAAPVAVAGPEALARALAGAQPGDVLELAGGDYGMLRIGPDAGGGAPLVLRAADASDPPRFAALRVEGARGLELDGLSFVYTFRPGDTLRQRPFRISNSQDVTLRNLSFRGDRATGLLPEDEGFPSAIGLALSRVTEGRVENSRFETWHRGIVITSGSEITLSGNDIHTIRSDGINVVSSQDILIENNHLHDFDRSLNSPDHADMIQAWTLNTDQPTRRLTIRGNLFDSGAGWFTQTIFMGNEEVRKGLAGPEMFYRDITIEENVILNAHYHGISLGEAEGVRIRNNTLVRQPGSEGKRDNPTLWSPGIQVAAASRDVVVAGNVTGGLSGYDSQPGWSVSGNLTVQDHDPQAPGFYGLVFAGARAGADAPLRPEDYRARPGGPLDGLGAGAAQLR